MAFNGIPELIVDVSILLLYTLEIIKVNGFKKLGIPIDLPYLKKSLQFTGI
jgi:hypothetical protein